MGKTILKLKASDFSPTELLSIRDTLMGLN
jgi:hypothetical protein